MENREKCERLRHAYGIQRSGCIVTAAMFTFTAVSSALEFPDGVIAASALMLGIGVLAMIIGYEMEVRLEDDHGDDY